MPSEKAEKSATIGNSKSGNTIVVEGNTIKEQDTQEYNDDIQLNTEDTTDNSKGAVQPIQCEFIREYFSVHKLKGKTRLESKVSGLKRLYPLFQMEVSRPICLRKVCGGEEWGAGGGLGQF